MVINNQILNILREIKPELVHRFAVANLGIIGSAVRDDFSETSNFILNIHLSLSIGYRTQTLWPTLQRTGALVPALDGDKKGPAYLKLA